MDLTFTPDENLTLENGPSYILILYAAMSIMYCILILFWLYLNGWNICTRKSCKLNRSLTFLFILKFILELMALFIFGWIEINGFLFFGIELYNIVTLLFNGIFYGILILVSRGWCITKDSSQLSPFDRQIGFITSFGMTLSEMVSGGYNKIASSCISVIFIIYLRIVLMSIEKLEKELKAQISDLDCQNLLPSFLIEPLRSRLALIRKFKILMIAFVSLKFVTKILNFLIAPLYLLMAEEALDLILFYFMAVLFRWRIKSEVWARLERDGSIWLSYEDQDIKYTIQRVHDQLILSREDMALDALARNNRKSNRSETIKIQNHIVSMPFKEDCEFINQKESVIQMASLLFSI